MIFYYLIYDTILFSHLKVLKPVNQFVIISHVTFMSYFILLHDKNGCLLRSHDIIHCAPKNEKQNTFHSL